MAGFVELTVWATSSDLMRLPAVVSLDNSGRATAVVVVAAVVVALVAALDLPARPGLGPQGEGVKP